MKRFGASLILLATVPLIDANAAVVTSPTCNKADVLSTIDQAQDGDTVQIPAGTCSWIEQLSIDVKNRELTIQGAGIDKTILIDDVNKVNNEAPPMMAIITVAGKKFRFCGMTIRGGPLGGDPANQNHGTIHISGDSKEVRVDHLKLEKLNSLGIYLVQDVWGVIDHNHFDLRTWAQGIKVLHDRWKGIGGYGDSSFADKLYLGTEKAIYIEDNTFIAPEGASPGVVDSYVGGRYVFRYNTIENDFVGTHGTEHRVRGVRSYEIYNNVFKTTNFMNWTGIFLRGGTGVIFNNSLSGIGGQTGYKAFVSMNNFRTSVPREYIQGMCDGSNPWDGNQDPSGYPCMDQLGRGQGDLLRDWEGVNTVTSTTSWPRNVSEPLYIWGNNWVPVPNNSISEISNASPAVIKENRDYFLSPMPGYKPFVYPHPLVSGQPYIPPPDIATEGPSTKPKFGFFGNVLNLAVEKDMLITIEVPEPTEVVLAVRDRQGREVRSLRDGSLSAGTATVPWDGKNNAGKIVSAGVYLLELKGTDTKKVVVVK